jgi:hypothetical protein
MARYRFSVSFLLALIWILFASHPEPGVRVYAP